MNTKFTAVQPAAYVYRRPLSCRSHFEQQPG